MNMNLDQLKLGFVLCCVALPAACMEKDTIQRLTTLYKSSQAASNPKPASITSETVRPDTLGMLIVSESSGGGGGPIHYA